MLCGQEGERAPFNYYQNGRNAVKRGIIGIRIELTPKIPTINTTTRSLTYAVPSHLQRHPGNEFFPPKIQDLYLTVRHDIFLDLSPAITRYCHLSQQFDRYPVPFPPLHHISLGELSYTSSIGLIQNVLKRGL